MWCLDAGRRGAARCCPHTKQGSVFDFHATKQKIPRKMKKALRACAKERGQGGRKQEKKKEREQPKSRESRARKSCLQVPSSGLAGVSLGSGQTRGIAPPGFFFLTPHHSRVWKGNPTRTFVCTPSACTAQHLQLL